MAHLPPPPAQFASKNLPCLSGLRTLSGTGSGCTRDETPEIRMRNPYQLPRALPGRLAAQLGHAVLGNDVVDVVLAGADVGSGAEHWHDA